MVLLAAILAAAPTFALELRDAPNPWTDEERAVIESVAGRLPIPPGGLVLVKRPGASLDRLGFGPFPERDRERGENYLYDPPASATEAERRALTARAVSHLVAHAWDDRLGLSDSRRWRSIAGWRRVLTAPAGPPRARQNPLSRWLRARATLSPSEEFATYAESFFLDTPAPDAPARCDEPSRYRVLADAFGALGHRPPLASATCPTFESELRPDRVDALEMLLASPSHEQAISMWGHLLVRIRYRDDRPTPPGLQPVFHIAAERGRSGSVRFAWRGLTGGVDARLFLTHRYLVRERYEQFEARSFKVFRLDLSAELVQRVLERFWELHRGSAGWPYYFFSDNCSGLLAEILVAPLLPEIDLASPRGIRFPTAILDLLHDGPGLVFERIDAGAADRAEAAEAERRRIAAGLLGNTDRNPRVHAKLAAVLARARDPDVGRRLAAYRAIAELEEAGTTADARGAYLRESLDVERYLRRASVAPGTVDTPLAELAGIYGDFLDRYPPPPTPALPPVPAARVPGRRAIGDSGAYTVRAALGAEKTASSSRLLAEFEGAVLDERLGEHRQRGFRADTGMTCLSGRIAVATGRFGDTVIAAHRWTLLDLRHPEWGFGLGGGGDREGGLRWSAMADAGPERFVVASEDRSAHLRVGLRAGLGAISSRAWRRPVPVVGSRASAAVRLELGRTTLDRIDLRIEAQPFLDARGRHAWQAEAEGSIAWRFGPASGSGWVLRPIARWSESRGVSAGGARSRTTTLLAEVTAPW